MKIRLAKKIVKLADEEEGSKEHPLGYWGTRFLIGIDHRITKAISLTSKISTIVDTSKKKKV